MGDLNDNDLDGLEEILDDDDDYIGTQTVYRCTDCGLELVVKEDEEAPDTCECGGDLQIVGEEIYDESQHLDDEDSGPSEVVILQDEIEQDEAETVGDSEQTDENTGLLFDPEEADEHEDGKRKKAREMTIDPEEVEDFQELSLEPEEEELVLDEEEFPELEGLEVEEEE